MTLAQLIAEMEKEARQPGMLIEAHRKTLVALVALEKRVDRLETAGKKK